ncbi:G-protein coupled receptor Mth2-like isoform X4 [Athalia rosae]|uniref:G-protein coupled receptor Mth2-like isoform X4 n=1 Tax=Athalia rosae TaxID=37344 RepID=UPI0020347A7A|nr:G-protein coupled receptor Mth2-like isoform X4 [Athalia rosae]
MHGERKFRICVAFIVGLSLAMVSPERTGDGGTPPVAPCPLALTVPLTPVQVGNGTISHEGLLYPAGHHWWDERSNVTLGCVCGLTSVKCLRKCCPKGKILKNASCVDSPDTRVLPDLMLPPANLALGIREIARFEDHFYILTNKICPNNVFILEPDKYPEDEFVLDGEGVLRTSELVLPPQRYCLDWQASSDEIRVLVCFVEEEAVVPSTLEMKMYPVGMILSIPFMAATFLVYAIIPELRNLYGKTLMCYVACLVNAYSFLAVLQLVDVDQNTCISLAFTIHFSFLASFFWLNVMCFDIWWTFGGFRALRGSIKQRERKKFFMYSIYAWGCAILLTAVCVIMDFVPGIPDTVIRPEFGEERCWFRTETAKALYFYGPMGLTVLCNIFLFVSTAIKIIRHKKDTAHHLKGTDSRRHDDNKQWFNLYLKLFIVMGINWSMEIISWLCQGPKSLWYITDMGNTLQGVIIFIIFVWKEKIKRLLIKRFGCQGPNFLPRDSTRSAYHSSASRTCTTSIPLHEETNGTPDPLSPSRAKPSLDDSDGV